MSSQGQTDSEAGPVESTVDADPVSDDVEDGYDNSLLEEAAKPGG